MPDGRLYIRPEKVEFCCGSLEEAYRRKRAVIRQGSVEDHLELARWCRRHGLLEFAQYTRPRVFRGLEVPPILLSGNHQEIARWREENSKQRTRARRADLLNGP